MIESRLKLSAIAVPAFTLALVAALTGSASAAPVEDSTPAPSYELGETFVLNASDDPLAQLPDATDDTGSAHRCDNPYREWRSIVSSTSYFVPSLLPGTSFKDGPGGKMIVSVTKAGSVKAEITAGGEAELSAVVASAKATINTTIGAEFTYTIGHTYQQDVSPRKYGHLQYGSYGFKVVWGKYRTSADRCGKTLVKSWTAKLPTRETGWKYWETPS
ncbi:hypothetical protein [Streptomyces vietnamensis]|uniref:hypothetical protein n=1 Tax=Streptomyces vietnamensis TaxID=362257 RepID=UPI001FDEF4FF|nr:hypothetical protein [Streptomyces vietnamensis]